MSRHDFPEDFKYENGQYFHRCHSCSTMFTGHKWRAYCKECDTIAEENNTAIENSVRRDLNNPLFSMSDRLEIAIGSAIFKEKVICNLRQQIKNLQQLLLQSGVDGIIIEQHQYKHLQESNDD